MIPLSTALAALLATAVAATGLERRQGGIDPPGYYSVFSWDNVGQVVYDNRTSSSPQYTVKWQDAGKFVAGKGWKVGAARSIAYSAQYNASENSFLAVYGWTRNPLVEYFIVENYTGPNPSGVERDSGLVSGDGSNYFIYKSPKVNQPSIDGNRTYNQYWSIRERPRTSGTITIGYHFNAFAALGLPLGSHAYQVVAVGGQGGSGSAAVSFTGSIPVTTITTTTTTTTTSTPTTTSSTSTTSVAPVCAPLWGQCGGQGWSGPTCCSAGTCTVLNQFHSQCLNPT